MSLPVHDLVSAGRAALRSGDPVAAREALLRAYAAAPTAEALEGLARAAYIELDFPQAIETWERAYAAYRERGDELGAVRVARTLGAMYLHVVGDPAVCNGWLARAQRLAADLGECAEHGWMALNRGMFEADREHKERFFRTALDVAQRCHDIELEVVTLAYLGASLVHDERTAEGMVLLDEALAAVTGGEIDDFCVLEEIFCQLFSACERAHDVARADQWISVGEDVARRRKLPGIAAFCRTHYGGILTAAGRWPEADAALTEAIRLWDIGRRSMLREGALIRLADLRVQQGRLAEAERLLKEADVDAAIEANRPLAAIHLARGDVALAQDILERALDQLESLSTAAAPLLALLVDVQLAAAAIDTAAATAEKLAEIAAHHCSGYLAATAALAKGRAALASGGEHAPAFLRQALTGFARAQLPLEVARCRLDLARALADERPEVAIAEARTALATFQRLCAARYADEATALLRSLIAPSSERGDRRAPITDREIEVLRLVAHGLNNKQIAARLTLSEHTVHRHVANILGKLGVSTRSSAVALAARRGLLD